MEYCYDLSIAEVRFCIKTAFPVNFPEYFRPFLRTEVFLKEKIDYTYYIKIGSMDEKSIKNDCEVRKIYWDHGKSIWLIARSIDQAELIVPPEFQKKFSQNANWLLYLALERPLLKYRRVILHASAVIYQGKSYLFMAPSGGGKSTQAQLWKKWKNAEIINGDKVILYDNGKELMAYGGPIAGSSGIYKNISAPVEAIIKLEKGGENQIFPLSRRNGYLLLYSEAVKSEISSEFNQKILQAVMSYPEKARFLNFCCVPDRTAVEDLLNYLSA